MKLRLPANNIVRIVLCVSLAIGLGVITAGTRVLLIRAATEPPRINVKKQTNVPLLISTAVVTSNNPLKPIYNYTLTNLSSKSVRAYTIKSEVLFGEKNAQEIGSTLTHLPTMSNLLQSNQSRHISGGGGSNYSEPVNEIILSVDFVEFADGSAWGEDYFKAAERLAGQRAGGKAAISNFRQKLGTAEFRFTSNEIESESLELASAVDKSKSSTWKDGYQSGIGIVRNRLNRALNEGGIEEVKKELEKPFDASEGRPDKGVKTH
ncbi:MAG TPA: hypothetical protein VF644_02940 [Pyrinomonadaceae bacterium]|jgi:hypothetical protein